ncbi:MAG: hypothetical protein KAR42_08175 [candidate division Zixibacteria bacterium]|nr:hypothetical protein [candidate division Zixibacteria bacterium]
MFSKIKSTAGMTMVELLIALLLTGIISAAMFKIYINQHQAWIQQGNVIEMQQNARAAMDELSRQLRMAGYGIPPSLQPFQAYNGDPDSIMIQYRGNDNVATLAAASVPSGSIDLTGSDLSHYCSSQEMYIFNPVTETGEYFIASSVDSASQKILHSAPLSAAYPAGSQVMEVARILYRLDKSDSAHPMLTVRFGNGSANDYAEDISDLQMNYKLKNGVVVDEPVLIGDVRQIAITLTARSSTVDPDINGGQYRSRVLHSRVYMRNSGT